MIRIRFFVNFLAALQQEGRRLWLVHSIPSKDAYVLLDVMQKGATILGRMHVRKTLLMRVVKDFFSKKSAS